MKIDATVRYNEEYLPTKRHRIPRIREVEEAITVEVRELKKEEAPLALVVTDYQSYLDENGNDQFGLRDTTFLAVDGQLFTQKKDMWGALDKGPVSLDSFVEAVKKYENRCYSYQSNAREESLRRLQEFVDSHVIIGGEVYRQSNEPRYVINTFGLGHNHGGTSMFIEYHYNENIRKENYFNALQREEAIAYANEVAARRGDTDDIGKFGDINIQVLMPELIRCNPQAEHGDGNPLLNSMECLVQSSGSSMEAGLLVMAGTAAAIGEGKKPSLSEQIQSAENKAEPAGSSVKTSPEHDR